MTYTAYDIQRISLEALTTRQGDSEAHIGTTNGHTNRRRDRLADRETER